MATSKKTNDPIVQVLSKLIDAPFTDENEKIKYYVEQKVRGHLQTFFIFASGRELFAQPNISCCRAFRGASNDVIEDVNLYQRMTKSKKLEILKIQSEFQQFCHKSRMALIEIADDSDIDDDERERFLFTLSAKNVDDFIN
ncbi:unnamed protein product, partial [Rotaria sp. Silwood2]